MKKIIRSTVLFLGVCFCAGKVNAQLASDSPAMTAEQFAKLVKEKQSTIPVQVVDTINILKTPAATVVAKKRPSLSDQDGVKPVLTSPLTKPVPVSESPKPASTEPSPVKIAEVKLPVAPVQDEKTKTKD